LAFANSPLENSSDKAPEPKDEKATPMIAGEELIGGTVRHKKDSNKICSLGQNLLDLVCNLQLCFPFFLNNDRAMSGTRRTLLRTSPQSKKKTML